jgi:predicted GNAT family acetyltransferase
MILSDRDASAAVEAFGKSPTREMAVKADKAVHRRWNAFHVDRAIKEVAESGGRGKEVARLLEACEGLRVPN